MTKQVNKTITVVIDAPCGINAQTSKSEEIDILAAITDRVRGTQTYLDSLFTDELLQFFAGKVKDDFCPNIMAEYYAEIENNRNEHDALLKAKGEIDSLKREKELNAQYDSRKTMEQDNAITKLNITVSDLRAALSEEREQSRLNAIERDTLAETVKNLKVMLFDLQNKHAA